MASRPLPIFPHIHAASLEKKPRLKSTRAQEWEIMMFHEEPQHPDFVDGRPFYADSSDVSPFPAPATDRSGSTYNC